MSAGTVHCTATFRPNPTDPLLATIELSRWLDSLPADAVLSAVQVDKGSQRDPEIVLVGIRAVWDEVR